MNLPDPEPWWHDAPRARPTFPRAAAFGLGVLVGTALIALRRFTRKD